MLNLDKLIIEFDKGLSQSRSLYNHAVSLIVQIRTVTSLADN